jgi:hypothetical protein
MENLRGETLSRKFNYVKNENPTIVSYLYGVVKIVRPVTMVTKKGNLVDKYEVAYKDITDNLSFEQAIKNYDEDKLQDILQFAISNKEFDSLEKFIFNNLV